MQKKVLLLIVAALTGAGIFADTVSLDDAKNAVRGWMKKGGKALGAKGDIKDVWEVKNDDESTLYYTVVTDGGAAIVASDTEVEPVIAFMPGSDGKIPEGHPLKAMLKADLPNRTGAISSVKSTYETKWTNLKRAGKDVIALKSMRALDEGDDDEEVEEAEEEEDRIIYWLDEWREPYQGGVGERAGACRVWNQDDSTYYFTNTRVFNLYTPYHRYCGCVATAASEIMDFWHWTKGATNYVGNCTVDGVATELKTHGGPYPWEALKYQPGDRGYLREIEGDELEYYARVASDVGIACNMEYTESGSGAYPTDVAPMYQNAFFFKSARAASASDRQIGETGHERLIYNQIRAGLPVILAIFENGANGHAVVACGYAESQGAPYTFINCGWGGNNDAWYNLPYITTKSTAGGTFIAFNMVSAAITMIEPWQGRGLAIVGDFVGEDGALIGDAATVENMELKFFKDETELNSEDYDRVEYNNETDQNFAHFGIRTEPFVGKGKVLLTSSGEEFTFTVGEAALNEQITIEASTLANALPGVIMVQKLDTDKYFRTYTDWEEAVEQAILNNRPIVYIGGALANADSIALRKLIRSDFSEEAFTAYHDRLTAAQYGVVDPRKFGGKFTDDAEGVFANGVITAEDCVSGGAVADSIQTALDENWGEEQKFEEFAAEDFPRFKARFDKTYSPTNYLAFKDGVQMNLADYPRLRRHVKFSVELAEDNFRTNSITVNADTGALTIFADAGGEYIYKITGLDGIFKDVTKEVRFTVIPVFNFEADDTTARKYAGNVADEIDEEKGVAKIGAEFGNLNVKSFTLSAMPVIEVPQTAKFYMTGVKVFETIGNAAETEKLDYEFSEDAIKAAIVGRTNLTVKVSVEANAQYRLEWEIKTFAYWVNFSTVDCTRKTGTWDEGWAERGSAVTMEVETSDLESKRIYWRGYDTFEEDAYQLTAEPVKTSVTIDPVSPTNITAVARTMEYLENVEHARKVAEAFEEYEPEARIDLFDYTQDGESQFTIKDAICGYTYALVRGTDLKEPEEWEAVDWVRPYRNGPVTLKDNTFSKENEVGQVFWQVIITK